MKVIFVPLNVIFDLIKEGEGKFYSRERYANVEMYVIEDSSDAKPSFDYKDEDNQMFIFLSKSQVMELFRDRHLSFEHDHQEINLKS